MDTLKINSCEYCSSTQVKTYDTVDDNNIKVFFVKCNNCKAQGPWQPIEKDAIIEWNALVHYYTKLGILK